MKIYFVKDFDPAGGFLDAFLEMPNPRVERVTIAEIREGEIPDDLWNEHMNEATPHPVTWWDDFYQPYFDEATVLWTRKGGYVNGTE